MIKSTRQVEMVRYESAALKAFYDKCKETGLDYYSGIADEISTDLMWQCQDDVLKLINKGDFDIISIGRPVEELIKEIEEVVENYGLEDYF
ncbi:inhibitor of MrcBC restriction [Citrobacter phage Moon]|uniref:Uncharacterized protein n=2 Tax=Moonvirus TaxID=1985329 RepID=A0A2H4YG53_9CAUD|nr:inhibitor of MrcBC restriction [Citrobacter phage Moon]YP_009618348.1 inhibitor of MrcBC restriction [Citrobacter phage CF1 ERZ-2017]AIX12253.1 hypothetical protein CPT_Moon282 [Citrobacter phage Moon]AUE23162.1 hypothetical protein Cf1_00299 [Citrobacter phage CF1 ERZ-2017]